MNFSVFTALYLSQSILHSDQPKRYTIPFSNHSFPVSSQCHHHPALGNHRSTSVSINSPLTFCTNGIIQYVVLWDWLLSWSTRFARFIHAAAFISTFLFTPNNIPLCGYITSCVSVHQLMEVCIVSTLWLLWVMLPWTCVYKVLCGHLFSFLLDVDRPRSRIAGSDTSCV